MKIRNLLLVVAVALISGQAESLPSVHSQVDVSRFVPPIQAGRLDGWEMHLRTDTEIAVCVNPVVYPDIKVIRCHGIAALSLIPEAQ